MQSEEWSEWDERHRRQSCEVAASERGQRASFKKISGNARRNSHCRFLVCFPSCRKQQKLKCWADRFCDLAHRWGRTIGKHIAPKSCSGGCVSCRAWNRFLPPARMERPG